MHLKNGLFVFAHLLVVLAPANTDEVVFTAEGLVAVPASYGHLVFSISEADIRRMYSVRATAVLDAYKRYLRSSVSVNLSCLSIGGNGCASDSDTKTSNMEGYYNELEAIVDSINSTVDELSGMAFRTPEGLRQKRSPFAIVTGVGAFVNFGIGIKNMWELQSLKRHVERTDARVEKLFIAVDSISRTQLRDHNMINKLVQQVSRYFFIKVKEFRVSLKRILQNRNGRALKELQEHEVYVDYKVALKSILQEALQCRNAFYSLFSGRLDPALVNFTSLHDAYAEVSKFE